MTLPGKRFSQQFISRVYTLILFINYLQMIFFSLFAGWNFLTVFYVKKLHSLNHMQVFDWEQLFTYSYLSCDVYAAQVIPL